MEKLMKTSKTVDTILKVFYRIMMAAGVIVIVGIGLCLVGGLIGVTPVTEVTGVTIGGVEIVFKEPQEVATKYMLTEMITMMVMALIAIATSCYLAKVLRRVLAPMTEGQPFVGTVSKEIKKLGIAVMVGGVVLDIVQAVCNDMMLFMYDFVELILSDSVSKIVVNSEFSLDSILVGVLVLMLSHVFRYGEQLQQQADETL